MTGNLTVNGSTAVLSGPLSVGVAGFPGPTTLAGLTIAYDDIAQIGVDDDYQPGQSTIYQLAAQALAEFHWQYTNPTTGAQDLMLLSNDVLSVLPSIQGNGTANILPNQTLSAGGSSILTKTLADGLYLSSAGGTITGNVTITGSASIGTLSTNFTGQGTDNRLTNQVANHANSILTKGIADGRYLSSGSEAGISFKFGSETVATSEHSIVLGHRAKANTNAISIGSFASNMGENMASGPESVALGYAARAPGSGAVALGYGTWSAGENSLSIVNQSAAYTNRSIAIGQGSVAYVPGQVAIGNYNVIENVVHTTWHMDPIFIVGNGTADNARSNAFLIRRNGDVDVVGNLNSAGNLTVQGTDNRLPNQVADNASSILTKGIADQQYVKIKDGGSSFIYGNSAIVEYTGIALGSNAQANTWAVSIGHHAGNMGWMASGPESVSIGYQARAPGERAVSLGLVSWGGGADSFAVNGGSTRTARSVAIGVGSEATRPGQIVLGAYNEYPYYSEAVIATDNIFVIGNGTADNARSNAFVVRRNGDVEVKGTSLTVNGAEVLTASSASSLYVTQSSASTTYLTSTAAATQYVTKTESADFLTTDDLIAIQANIDEKIDADDLEAALENVDLSGNYLSKDPATGLAYGTGSSASANTSVALGENVVATRQGEVVVGRHNKPTPAGTASALDPVFVVGAGSGESGQPGEKKNALVVRRDGNIHVEGVLRVKPAGNLSMEGYQEGPEPGEE